MMLISLFLSFEHSFPLSFMMRMQLPPQCLLCNLDNLILLCQIVKYDQNQLSRNKVRFCEYIR